MKKIIVYDLLCAQPVGNVKFHGGGEYTKVVFKSLISMRTKEVEIFVCYNTSEFLDDWVREIIDKNALKTIDVKTCDDVIKFLHTFNNESEVRFFAGLGYGYKNVVFPENVVSIGTFHGLRSIEKQYDVYTLKYYTGLLYIKERIKILLKKFMRRRYYNMFYEAMKSFDVIITDSKHSAYSLKLNFPDLLKDKQLHIFYPLTQVDREIQKDPCNENYIMMISANRWIKNSYRGLKAIDGLFEKKLLDGYFVKVFGSCPKKVKRGLKNKSRFMFYDYVSEEELENAFHDCSIMYYPTLNEGFGNVPMEAIKYNKTCVVSAVCSLPEVYSDIVYYCNPYDIMEMQNRLLQASENQIDATKLTSWLNGIQARQNKDMRLLCELICGTEIKAC